MKKVLITTTTYPLNERDTQPRFIYSLADKLSDNFDVTVLAPRGIAAKKDEKIGRVIVRRYPYFISKFETLVYGGGILENLRANRLRYVQIPFLFIAQFFSIWKIIKKKNIEIINAHWIIPQGLVAILVKKLSRKRVKVIITSHGGDLYGLRFLNRIKTWTLNNADSIVVVSSAMKNFCYNNLGVDSAKIIYIRSMGVNLTSTFVQKVNFEDKKNIIFVGRIAEKKGLPILITALNILHKQGIKLNLTVVGDGNGLAEIISQVERFNLTDYVTFKGRVINSEIPAILNKHAIFVMPSIVADDGDQEGLGLVAIEAMGCGCAVIATDLEAIRDVINSGETGILFEPGNEKDLANQIRLLDSNIALRFKYAGAGNRFALNKFDWSKVIRNYSEILRV